MKVDPWSIKMKFKPQISNRYSHNFDWCQPTAEHQTSICRNLTLLPLSFDKSLHSLAPQWLTVPFPASGTKPTPQHAIYRAQHHLLCHSNWFFVILNRIWMRMPPKSYVVVSTCSAPSWSRFSTTGGQWRHRRRPPLSTNDRQPTRSRLEARRERRISSTTTTTTSTSSAGAASSQIRIWRWSDGFVKISTPKKFQPRLKKASASDFVFVPDTFALNSYFCHNQSWSFNYRTQITFITCKKSLTSRTC